MLYRSIDLCVALEKKIFNEIMHFHRKQKNPWPSVYEVYGLGRPFLDYHYYIPNLSDLCLGEEMKNFEEIRNFHYTTCMAKPYHKSSCPRGHEIYNFGRPCFGHHHFKLSDPCPGVEKNTFKEIRKSYKFYPKIKSPWGGGHDICNFVSPYPTDSIYKIW